MNSHAGEGSRDQLQLMHCSCECLQNILKCYSLLREEIWVDMLFSELFINALTGEEAFIPIPQFKVSVLSPALLTSWKKGKLRFWKSCLEQLRKEETWSFPTCLSTTKLMFSVGASEVEFPLILGQKKCLLFSHHQSISPNEGGS